VNFAFQAKELVQVLSSIPLRILKIALNIPEEKDYSPELSF
jgi:hypothetical protein